MHLFYAPDLGAGDERYTFPEEESKHCVRVLRLGAGDRVHITDGRGLMCLARIEDVSPRACTVVICERHERFEQRDYTLHIAVAPTKNIERFEWFVEKATEIGVDRITPLLTDHCERRIVKRDRLEKVATSAVKQSLKAYHPEISELTSFKDVVSEPFSGHKFIAHCEADMPKTLLREAVRPGEAVFILIGPEGDFSPEEITFARANGFKDLSLGRSRLRTETAAVAAVHSIAFINE